MFRKTSWWILKKRKNEIFNKNNINEKKCNKDSNGDNNVYDNDDNDNIKINNIVLTKIMMVILIIKRTMRMRIIYISMIVNNSLGASNT